MDNKLSQPYWDRISLFGNINLYSIVLVLANTFTKPFSETRLLDIRFLNIFKGTIATGKKRLWRMSNITEYNFISKALKSLFLT